MKRRRLLNLVLASGALSLLAGRVTAHSLPGTVITVSYRDASAAMRLELPADELALALPSFAPDQTGGLADYFAEHIGLTTASGAACPQDGATFAIAKAESPDVGTYELLVADLSFGLPPRPDYPLRLRFDAIIHAVRNHRAEVFLQVQGRPPVPLGHFAYDYGTKSVPAIDLPDES